MQRLALNIGVSAAAAAAGVIAILRGQTVLGICLIGLAALRALATLATRKPRKPEPEIKLNLDNPGDSER